MDLSRIHYGAVLLWFSGGAQNDCIVTSNAAPLTRKTLLIGEALGKLLLRCILDFERSRNQKQGSESLLGK